MEKKSSQSSRREFVQNSVLASAGFFIVPRYVLGGKGFVAPSDKVNVGVVGVGGRGKQNVQALLQLDDVQVAAIADPAEFWDLHEFYYNFDAGKGPVSQMITEHYADKTPDLKLQQYEDFREMLEKESGLDAILCATPDHMHAYVTINALQQGKHVYCEKPLTHNIWEARMVKKLAKESGLATQMGNQLHSTPRVRDVVEYLRAGAIGKVKEVHAWVPATRWGNSNNGQPEGVSAPIPEGFEWDLWLGPRSERPYHEAYTPVTWRDYWDFGCGALGDFGCHDMDAAVWGMDLPLPESVEVLPAGYSDEHIAPYGEIGYYHFPAHNGNPPVKLTWYGGGLRPPTLEMAPKDFRFSRRASMYVGEKGIMVSGAGPKPRLFPDELHESFTAPEPTIAESNGHHRDWVDAIKGGPKASSNFEYATHLTEITLLGVLSLRLGGRKVYWDGENMKAIGNPEADQFIKENIRSGWEMGLV